MAAAEQGRGRRCSGGGLPHVWTSFPVQASCCVMLCHRHVLSCASATMLPRPGQPQTGQGRALVMLTGWVFSPSGAHWAAGATPITAATLIECCRVQRLRHFVHCLSGADGGDLESRLGAHFSRVFASAHCSWHPLRRRASCLPEYIPGIHLRSLSWQSFSWCHDHPLSHMIVQPVFCCAGFRLLAALGPDATHVVTPDQLDLTPQVLLAHLRGAELVKQQW